ncbi:hypothetical protein B0H15DRAFT_946914 [Mycena belliarum]|uniref:Uncharacterized protein n=1 Tax=Mycena belliarum TaxID=1033014 RepID=A0AAD6UBB6_9AGAR|nr:hypothetical protein B0H15DRAFT_946914 [Mycena belliae]
MHLLPLPLALLLLALLPILSAAPTSALQTDEDASADASAKPSSSLLSRIVGSRVPASHALSTTNRATSHKPTAKPTAATTKHRHGAATTSVAANGQITLRPGNPTHPVPVPIPSFAHTHHPRPRPSRGPPIAALVLEILGALAGCLFLLSIMRCVYSYNRTPARDRISAILHRHQLQREMEELERNPPNPRRSLVEPPPPYIPPPPSYGHGGDRDLLGHSPAASLDEDAHAHGQTNPLHPNG